MLSKVIDEICSMFKKKSNLLILGVMLYFAIAIWLFEDMPRKQSGILWLFNYSMADFYEIGFIGLFVKLMDELLEIIGRCCRSQTIIAINKKIYDENDISKKARRMSYLLYFLILLLCIIPMYKPMILWLFIAYIVTYCLYIVIKFPIMLYTLLVEETTGTIFVIIGFAIIASMNSFDIFNLQYEPTKLMLKFYEKTAEAFIVSGLIYQSKRYAHQDAVRTDHAVNT